MKKKLFVLLLSIISVACLAFGVSACSKTNTDDIAVTSVSISSTEISLEVGESYTLSATILPSNATNTNVTWSSSATSVATVSGGKVTAVSVGTAIITVTTTDGGYTDTCTVKVEETSTHIHSYTSVITAPTCTEGGYTTYTCECGDSYVADETEATGHSWDKGTVTTAATCTTDGVKTYTCPVCNETKTETIPATGHTEAEAVTENEVAATCTEDGSYDSVIYCSVCNAELSRETVTIPATGHTEANAVTENEVAATCTEDGSYDSVIYCSVCSAELSRETITIPATGHTEAEAVTENKVTATCTGAGSYDAVVYCSKCGEELSRETVVVPATGHTLEQVEAQAPTCTEIGWNAYEYCTVCDYTTYEEIPALGHTADEAVTENYKAATCTEAGSYDSVIYCSVCGAELSRETITISATGHTWNSGEVTKKATCTEEGEKTYTCTACGEKYTETIATVAHSYDEDGVCTVCDHTVVGSEGLAYTISSDGTYYTVSGIGDCGETNIIIPFKYNNIPVTAIAESAFSGNTTIISVYIPDSVTTIGSYAFSDCTALESVTIGKGVTTIVDHAFYNCTALTEINYNATSVSDLSSGSFVFAYAGQSGDGITVTIGANVTKIPAYLFYPHSIGSYAPKIISVVFEDGSQCTSIGIDAFHNCSSLTSIDIPDSVTTIGSSAFYDCTALESVTIGKGVTTIGADAFHNCSSLTSIDIPDSVTTIESYAFYDCTALKSVTIGKGVTTIGKGAFYNCSSLTSITIPDSVTTIESSAFYGCTALESVTIGKGITTIGTGAFYYCGSLTNITIPDSVTSIGDEAFACCSSLTSIYIPEGVTSIGIYAFYNCSSLTSIDIPDSVTTIGRCAFYNCSSLTSIDIPEGVTSIESYAFYGCTALESVTIGEGVTTIGDYAFYNCSSLTSVYYNGTADGWSNISIGSDNTALKNATIYYYSATAENGCWYYDADGSVKIWYCVRVDENGNEDETGNYVYFGSYPQTLVTDATITTELESLAGTLPTSSDSYSWTSYGYYISNSNSTDYMWYIDITYNGGTYRGVYFTSYRPYNTSNSSSTSYSNQDNNGYSTNTLYWFKYEPILWRILTTEDADGATYATILCEMLIDSQEYNYTTSSTTLDDGTIVYANNYAYSSIRAWLNENFYYTAFSESEKSLIQLVDVDNSASTTNSSDSNSYACEDTYDYVWLLSYQDVLNTEYGFSSSSSNTDTARQKQTTDYAQCQGANTSTSTGDGSWLLRSPDSGSDYKVCYVSNNGSSDSDGSYNRSGASVYETRVGVCPALKIRLS